MSCSISAIFLAVGLIYYKKYNRHHFYLTPYCKPPALPVRSQEALPFRGKGMK
jgi:hypothetical protein